jgi:hypothetical protein
MSSHLDWAIIVTKKRPQDPCLRPQASQGPAWNGFVQGELVTDALIHLSWTV